MLVTRFLEDRIRYDGSQLAEGWAADRAGGPGPAHVAVAFVGPCDVAPEYMVDLEDLRDGSRIFSREMVHFIVEHAGPDLEKAVLHQRLLVCIAAEVLAAWPAAAAVRRRHDDLYDGKRKLSISIATTSERSALIHLALNVRTGDFPLPVKGIADYDVEPRRFAEGVLQRYARECDGMDHAQTKVRHVGRWEGGVHA